MTDQFLSGTWLGTATYGDNYPESLKGKQAPFELTIKAADGSFSGTCEDEITKPHLLTPASINGFVEDGFISFIKQYPYRFHLKEDGSVETDMERNHPEIHYSGMFNEETNTFSGIWEIEVIIEEGIENNLSYFLSGNWEIKKA